MPVYCWRSRHRARGNSRKRPRRSGRTSCFILADDLGFSDLGCYGGEIETPNVNRLAEDGLRFTQAYNTARCWPSRAAPLTGYYPQQVNRDPPGQRPNWAALLPDLLRPAGYRSYHSGKWHVDGPVLRGGFAVISPRGHGPLLLTEETQPRRPPFTPAPARGRLLRDRGDCGTRDRLACRARVEPSRPAVLPLHCIYVPAFPDPGSPGGHRSLPQSLQGRLGSNPSVPLGETEEAWDHHGFIIGARP